jgi:hypothetical protein
MFLEKIELTITANIENSGDSRFSDFGSPHQVFVSVDRNTLRIPLLSILAKRYATFKN